VRAEQAARCAGRGVQSGTNAVLVVKHRDMNEKELEAQEARRAQLENHEPEEEEEEEMEAEKAASGFGPPHPRPTLCESEQGNAG
ncbi:hypothetical protein Q9233_017720, partial [Columba guinea]